MLRDFLDITHPDDKFPKTIIAETRDELWDNMKRYINHLKINQRFTRKKLLRMCYTNAKVIDAYYYSSNTTMDLYRFYLTKLGMLKFMTHDTYQKLTYIPKRVHIELIRQILLDETMKPWKEWVIPLHEKLGVAEEELYNKGEE
jgi:hypothetical protein